MSRPACVEEFVRVYIYIIYVYIYKHLSFWFLLAFTMLSFLWYRLKYQSTMCGPNSLYLVQSPLFFHSLGSFYSPMGWALPPTSGMIALSKSVHSLTLIVRNTELECLNLPVASNVWCSFYVHLTMRKNCRERHTRVPKGISQTLRLLLGCFCLRRKTLSFF